MKKRTLKLFGLLLVICIVSSCCIIMNFAVSAGSGDIVYFDNSVTKFSTPYCYMWKDGSGNNGEWPGKPMTLVEGDVWSYTVPGDYDKIIFNSGSGQQSADLDYAGNGQIAKPNGNGDKFTVSWSAYIDDPTAPTNPTTPTTPTTPPPSAGTVHCQNDANWSEVYCYMWNSSSDSNAGWPGVKMTSVGDGVFVYNYSKSYANVIFSQNGGSQTSDLNYPGDDKIWNNSTNKWEDFSDSPVKITAFTASQDSPSYTQTSITLSATAKSDAGGLSYNFKVNGVSISSGAASSTVWVPTSAGNYKLAVEVTDAKGETNTRSMDFVIKDATALEEVYVRGLTNSLGTSTQIKQNSNITFTSDAIGGNVGTGLLFYKFKITDPSGNTNTAYYTTSKNYTYTPTKLGKYTIETSVQNSYNNTQIKTYSFDSVATITEEEPTTPTEPSTPTTPTSSTTPTSPTTPTTPTDPTATGKKGDADGNGVVNINDVTTIQMYLAKYDNVNINLTLADVTGDKEVKIQDANTIQRYLAKLITSL